jgi:hypothetical protein
MTTPTAPRRRRQRQDHPRRRAGAALEIIDRDGAEALSMRLEDILALLTRAGFSGPDDLLRLGLHRLPIGEFPLLRGLAPVLAVYNGAAELERGLDILLTGLTTTLNPQPARPTPTRAEHRAAVTGSHPSLDEGIKQT